MRKLLGIGAIVLGVVGVPLCVVAIALGWYTAVRTVDRIVHVAERLDQGLAEADKRLARVETHVNGVRKELHEIHAAAEALAAENPELPRVQAAIERLIDLRLKPALDRADAIAETLRSVAEGLRTAAEIVDQLHDDPEATARVRKAADTVNRAADELNGLRARIEATKVAKAARLTREIVVLAREAVVGCDQLAEGLAAARQEIVTARGKATEGRDEVVFWVYFAATANTLFWLWGGLGQLCLIGWGRRRFAKRAPGAS